LKTVLLFFFLYALIFLMCYFSVFSETKNRELKKKSLIYPAAALLCGWFVIQLVLGQTVRGYIQDMDLFTSWASFAEDHAVWEYYTTDLYVDYPPVYLYVLYGIGKLAQLFCVAPETSAYIMFLKFVPILFDALTTVCIYQFSKAYIGEKKALILAFLSAVNPVRVLDSTFWGQIDSVTCFAAAGMLLALYNRRYVLSISLFTLLFLTKPQLIVFAPLLFFVMLFDLVKSRQTEAWKKMLTSFLLSALSAVLILVLVPLPATSGNYGLLLANYQKALGLYPYATLNAANLFGALGGNWIEYDNKLFMLSYQAWGYIFIVGISLFVGYRAWKDSDRKSIFSLGVLLVLGVFMLGHSMHERYSLPALLLLILMYVLYGERKWLLFYGAFSLTGFINCAWVLIYNWQEKFIEFDNVPFRLLSLVQVILFALWFYFAFVKKEPTAKKGKATPAAKRREKKAKQVVAPLLKTEGSRRLKRIDYWLMLGLTVLYAVFGFYRLGSLSVPETGWYPEAAQESVTLDLGSSCDVEDMHVYAGWIDRRTTDHEVMRDLIVMTSEDGETWQEEDFFLTLDSVFRWHRVYFEKTPFRYVKMICDDNRFYMNEVALFGQNGTQRFMVEQVLSDNETAQLLIDEQDKVQYEFSWYDGTYFDEIYHPRTAYEYIHHLYPYENTHPPLGKVIISAGIMLFGMNPFGWRFFGTLCGVLMVPLMYVMGKKMFKRTIPAFVAAFLFSFDFMHLSQTRIATIDSYTTLFVMAMYLFMFLYMEKSENGEKGATLSLFLSGLCFGLGAATKWQGVYAGLGLAFLYFFRLARHCRIKLSATAMTGKRAGKVCKPEIIKSIVQGFLFFVVVPAIVYFVSYIPAMMTESTGLSFFFTNQGSMLHYHSTLEEPHAYGSSWWQWPLDFKPLYAYSPNRNFVPEGMAMGITSMGNPLIWWATIPTVIWSIVQLVRKRETLDLPLLVSVVGFFSLYVPWIFVTRTAFIYHFFPCVAFVVFMIVRFIMEQIEENPRKKLWLWFYMGAVFVLFLAFYPVLTGMKIPETYALLLRWVPGWVLG